jgi:hypothetical protein
MSQYNTVLTTSPPVSNEKETLSYFSNFDDNSFLKDKPREFNKLRDDVCDIKQRNYSNDKALKFVTTTFRDLLDAQEKKNMFGVDIEDQLFVPAELMDQESSLKYGVTGGVLTNCNVRHEYGQLPLPTMPQRYQLYHGDVGIEDTMRNYIGQNKKSCNPHDYNFHNRSFYMFEGIEQPDATKNIEEKIRCGESSRYPVVQGNTGVKIGKNYKTPVDITRIEPSQKHCNLFEFSSRKC